VNKIIILLPLISVSPVTAAIPVYALLHRRVKTKQQRSVYGGAKNNRIHFLYGSFCATLFICNYDRPTLTCK